MRYWFSFCLIFVIKHLAMLLFRFKFKWLSPMKRKDWSEVKLIVLLNHTSLFEPVFLRAAPNHFIWRLAKHFTIPGADKTWQRPMVGRFFKLLLPGAISISRTRDESWDKFMHEALNNAIVGILPEGRMRRRNGLDTKNRPMSIKYGVADIIAQLEGGKILFVYSGGLHQIQAPGEKKVRLFRTVRAKFEVVDLDDYKARLVAQKDLDFADAVVSDFSQRQTLHTPSPIAFRPREAPPINR